VQNPLCVFAVLSVKITHFQQNSRFAALSEKSQGQRNDWQRNKKQRGHDYSRAKPYPLPFFPKSKTAGKKMEAKKFLVFMFLPPYFCHGLFVWSYSPAASGLFHDTAYIFALVAACRAASLLLCSAMPWNFAFFASFFEQEKTEGTESCSKLSTPPFPQLPPVQIVFLVAACHAASLR
jgi:hypothetical protein